MTDRVTQAEYRRLRPRRQPVEREHFEQVELFKWVDFQQKRIPELALLFAIPNGGKRSKAVAGKLKAEGVRAGVPDLCLPVARGPYHGMFIELKAKGGRLAETQRDWLRALSGQNYYACICVGWEEAKKMIETYLRYGPPLGEGVM